MTEQPKSKLAGLGRELVQGSMSERERRRRGLSLPELRLRPDAPAIEIDETTQVMQALAHLGTEQTSTLALREPSGEPKAIVLSVERYLQLVSKEINSAHRVGVSGHIGPEEAAFTRAHVEQVDPSENWNA